NAYQTAKQLITTSAIPQERGLVTHTLIWRSWPRDGQRELGRRLSWLIEADCMPLYWLCYRHNNQISVVIEPEAPLIHGRLRASLDGLDQGEFRGRPRA